MKNFLKKLGIGLLTFLFFSQSVSAIDIVTSSGVWYRNGDNMQLNPSTLHVGSSPSPIAKIWVTDMNVAGTLTVSGITMTGNLDLDGYNLIMDTDGDTQIVNDRDAVILDNEIGVAIGGAMDFLFQANIFSALSGSAFWLADDSTLRFGNTAVAPDSILNWNTAQTQDALFLGTGGSRNIVVADVANVNFDFAHGNSTDSTLFLHSRNQSTTQWLGLSHNATDAVLATGTGNIAFAPSSGIVSTNGLVNFSAGLAITAASYQIGRDADATNQLHFNVPTGASFEFSVNDVAAALVYSNIFYAPIFASLSGTTLVRSDVTDGGGAQTAVRLYSNTVFTNPASKLFALKNGVAGSDLFYVDMAGVVIGTSFQIASVATYGSSALVDVVREYGTANGLRIRGNMADGAAAYGVKIGATTPLTVAGAKIAAFFSDSFTTEKASVNLNGYWQSPGATYTIGATDIVTLNAAAHTGLNVQFIDFDVNSAGVNGLAIDGEVSTALSGGEAMNGLAIDVNGNAGDLATSQNNGLFITSAGTTSISGAGLNTGIRMNGYWDTGILISRSVNFTGIDTETSMDMNVSPIFTLTKPAAGQYTLFGANIDLSGITVNAGAGTSIFAALRLVANTDIDVGTNYALFVEDGASRFGGRILAFKGADVTPAATVTLGFGNAFAVSASATAIDCITTTDWTPGSEVTFVFAGISTVNDSTGGCGANTANVDLTAAFVSTAGDTLKIIFNGTNWSQIASSVN